MNRVLHKILRYLCHSCRIPQYLHVDGATGVVTTRRSLNRESFPLFEFLILARDLGDPPRSAITKVKVAVLDVNDERPVFEQPKYEVTLLESAPPSFLVQIQVCFSESAQKNNSFETSVSLSTGTDELASESI